MSLVGKSRENPCDFECEVENLVAGVVAEKGYGDVLFFVTCRSKKNSPHSGLSSLRERRETLRVRAPAVSRGVARSANWGYDRPRKVFRVISSTVQVNPGAFGTMVSNESACPERTLQE